MKTPPQEFDLPLAEGFTPWGIGCRYFKTQDGVITLNVNITHASVTGGTEILIANLPVGFRPGGTVIAGAYTNHFNDLGSKPGYLLCDYLGQVMMRGDADWNMGHASITFLAYF